MPDIPLTVHRRDHEYIVRVADMPVDAVFPEIEKASPGRSYVAVVDNHVADLHRLDERIAARANWRCLRIGAGEEHKNAADYIGLCEALLNSGIDRRTILVAIGGGVVGDLTGFAAATLLRGIRFVQVPTTLLAQVDSSVGGKTGINLAGGKNQLGAFYQPEFVVANVRFLLTLTEREYRAGLAEVVKYGVLGDRAFFRKLTQSAAALTERDPEILAEVVARCCRMKADIVGSDEKEAEGRRLLNLGHTFGHVLEALAGYDGTLLHGEAIALGMAMAVEYSVREGKMAPTEADMIVAGCRALGLPTNIDFVFSPEKAAEFRRRAQSDELSALLLRDKKAAEGVMTLVLPTSVGMCQIVVKEPVAKVAAFMRELIGTDGAEAK